MLVIHEISITERNISSRRVHLELSRRASDYVTIKYLKSYAVIIFLGDLEELVSSTTIIK